MNHGGSQRPLAGRGRSRRRTGGGGRGVHGASSHVTAAFGLGGSGPAESWPGAAKRSAARHVAIAIAARGSTTGARGWTSAKRDSDVDRTGRDLGVWLLGPRGQSPTPERGAGQDKIALPLAGACRDVHDKLAPPLKRQVPVCGWPLWLALFCGWPQILFCIWPSDCPPIISS